jgi:UDP:flavonoid glycosyltransferase YjiC (YdhE family)
VIAFRRYTAARGCQELRELLANPSYSQRAAEIGMRIDAEDGVRSACERIESVLAAPPHNTGARAR